MEGIRIETGKVAQVVHLLVEGVGIRAASRLTNLDQETILNIVKTAGQTAAQLLDGQILNVTVESVQCDELFAFVYCKDFNNLVKNPDHGTQYTFLAVDRKSKLILSHLIGKRDRECADAFMLDLRKRIKGRCQLTTDGFQGYLTAVYNAFGAEVDFAQQTKTYADRDFGAFRDERRYSVAKGCVTVKTDVHIGSPNRLLVSTSHVERTNLSVRLFNRRFARLTLGYSKKLENLKHAVALFIAHFNFCRKHSAHSLTPAQAAGLTDHTWTLNELLGI